MTLAVWGTCHRTRLDGKCRLLCHVRSRGAKGEQQTGGKTVLQHRPEAARQLCGPVRSTRCSEQDDGSQVQRACAGLLKLGLQQARAGAQQSSSLRLCGAGTGALALISSLPVPKMKPASVLPMPEANWPKAPALQVCESVPKSTSPAGHSSSAEGVGWTQGFGEWS